MAYFFNTSDINQTFIIEPLSITGGSPTLTACTALYANAVVSCSGDTQILMGNGVITFNGNLYTNNDLTADIINASTYYSGGTNLFDIIESKNITGGTFNSNTDTLNLFKTNGSVINVTGFTDYYTTGATIVGSTAYFNRNDMLSAYTLNMSAFTTNTFVTGVTFTNNQLVIVKNDGTSVNTFINTFTGLTVTGLFKSNSISANTISANTISATTYYGDGSYLTGIVSQDTYVTGGTYSAGTAIFTNNTGGTFNVTGFSTSNATQFTGGTVTGFTFFSSGLSATTISATTYLGLPITTDIFVTGGTYNEGVALFTNNSGDTFNVTGFTTPFTGGTVDGPTIFTNGLTANTFALSTNPNINTTNTDVLTLNQSTGVIEQRSINNLINVVNLITVGLSGSTGVDYNSIKEAVDSVTGANATNTYVVKVGPGVFYENPITMKSYVDVVGESETNTIIQANNPNTSLIIGADQSMINNVQIQGCTGTGVAAVIYSSPTTPQLNAIFYVENVRFGANYTHAKTVGTGGGNCIMQCSNVKYGGYPFTIGFYVTNDGSGIGRMQLRNVTSTNGGVATTSGLIFAKADQPSCAFIVNGALLTKSVGAPAGVGFWIENGGVLRATSVNFQRWATAIYAPQIGSAPSIDGLALNFEGCTTDVNIIHSGATGKIQGTDNYSKTLINIDAPLYEVNHDPRIITVAKKGGDFTSVKSAVDSITGSSINNRFLVSVGPGRFSEGEIDLTGKPYVSVEGSNIITTEIVPNNNTQHIFKIGQNNELSFFSLSGAPSGYAAIYVYDIGDYAQAHKISFNDCDTNVWVESDTQDTIFFGEYLDFNGSYSYGVKIIANNGYVASANMENYYNFPTGTGTTIANSVQGSGGTLSVFVGDGVGNGVTGSTNYQVFDYGSLNTTTTTADGWDYCVRNPNIGGPSRFDIDGISVVNSMTYDVSVEHPNTFGTFNGSASHVKVNTLSNNVYWSFLDIDDGEFDVTRKISVTFQDGTHTDASTLIFEGSTMGLFDGGIITHLSGLTFEVSAGFGYLEKTVGDGIHMRIDWVPTQITLLPNSENYIYFNENEILSVSSNAPNNVNNIILGRVVTDSSTVRFIDSSPYVASHTSNLFSDFNRNALGPIYSTGSIVTENATPYHLNISSGDYYYSENNFKPSGGTDVSFVQYYRDGSSGWVTTGTTEVVNGYDDNSGFISPLPLSSFTKHTMYVVGDSTNEKYMLVLGQTYYTSLVEAEGADLPTPPNYFDDGVTTIANIIIQQGVSGITQIQDIRPVIGFKAAGVSATAVHGNLLGLTSDDHKQYLLVDGSRAMTNNLSMGGNAIVSALTVNNVVVESHASRHKNGGADEIATATPAPSEIPKADTFGKLDGWISDASTTVKGLTRLSSSPASASVPIAVGVNDTRFLNSISGVTNTSPSLIFRNNSGGTITLSNIRLSGITATTISATTYQNLPISIVASNNLISTGLNGSGNGVGGLINNSIILGVSAGEYATNANSSNFIGRYAGYYATSATFANFLGEQAGFEAANADNSNFIGYLVGYQATNANNSNFIGSYAGKGATNANNSNFLGQAAGENATDAYQSNFIGQQAGLAATNASQSNFLGLNTGKAATNASFSNFFGVAAGQSATDANNSNFMGQSAGFDATNANNSNFFGQGAGKGGVDAYDSNFMGQGAGEVASNASFSNFMGYQAGREAANAYQSNFLGYQAGYLAINAYQSSFLGESAGYRADNADNSNFMGNLAGYDATNANSSNFMGHKAGQSATDASNSNFLGRDAGNGATNASFSNFMGNQAGYSAVDVNNSNFMGQNAGNGATNAFDSNFFGKGSGVGATNAHNSNFLGNSAGQNSTNANDSNFFGQNAGYNASDSAFSNFIGFYAGYAASNTYNSSFIGYSAGQDAYGSNNTNIIGYYAGFQSQNSFKLNIIGNYAGFQSPNSTSSNFLGDYAGFQSPNVTFSNFIGHHAGLQSSTINNSNFIGESAGKTATNANYSNFMGSYAGNQSQYSEYSNFIGDNAGQGATSGYSSNFIGRMSGKGSNNSNNSNFFGYGAGEYSYYGYDSNFMGQNAGQSSFGSNYSNFMGNNAGQGAYVSNWSNFFGERAGKTSQYSNNSNFMGQGAGQNAINAYNSNFIGQNAGLNTSGAYQSNFFGQNAGESTSAYNSNFIGFYAGNFATNAYQSTFIGAGAGQNATSSNDSTFIGYQAGQNATIASNSVFIGNSAGYEALYASSSNFLGNYAGYQAPYASNSNFMGIGAGQYATYASNSNFFGQYAGSSVYASNSNFIGQNAGNGASNAFNSNFLGNGAGQNATGAYQSNFLGDGAGLGATNASYSNLFGYHVGLYAGNNIGSNNIIIGTNISLPMNTSNSINLGNVLYGINTNSDVSSTPIINPMLDGKIGIGIITPLERLHVAGNVLVDGDLTASTISATTYLNLPAPPTGTTVGSFGITIDGAGSVITTGIKGYTVLPYNATITGWDIVGDASGSCVIDVWKSSAGTIPTVANTITGTEKPTLAAQQINSDNNLTSWTTGVSLGDVIAFNVNSATSLTRVNLIIKVIKT